VSPDVDLDEMASCTNGYSGADLTGICQRAVKLAIRESIAREVAHEKRKENDPVYAEQWATRDFDPVPEITRVHFEESMKNARVTVPQSDVRRYEMFASQLQQSRGFGEFRFSNNQDGGAGSPQGGNGGGGGGGAPRPQGGAGGNADDDLYG
jgi:transitional endoplasmic reticulum ATPase